MTARQWRIDRKMADGADPKIAWFDTEDEFDTAMRECALGRWIHVGWEVWPTALDTRGIA